LACIYKQQKQQQQQQQQQCPADSGGHNGGVGTGQAVPARCPHSSSWLGRMAGLRRYKQQQQLSSGYALM
jgi:hypothetical protein